MKRALFLLAAIVLLAGCTEFNDVDKPNYGGDQGEDILTSIYAGFADEDSRTYVENDVDVLWQNGDALSLFYSQSRNLKFVYNGESGERMAKFDFVNGTGVVNDNSLAQLKAHAIYPYNANATTEYDEATNSFNISTVLPTTQSYAPNSFGCGANVMVAASDDYNELENRSLYFRNVCGHFTVKLYGEGVKVRTIKLTSRGVEKLAGNAIIQTYCDQAPVVTMADDASTSVTLDCGAEGVALGADKENATEFWFALPPTAFKQGLKIEITSTEGVVCIKETTKQIDVERNKIQPMAAFKFEQSIPSDNALWYTLASGSTSKFDWGQGQSLFNVNVASYYYDDVNERFVVWFAHPLTTIKDDAFKDVADLKTITLPRQVTHIGNNAFRNCTNLTTINIPESAKTIGTAAFRECNALQSITIPASVESIGDEAFYNCSSMKTVRIEDADTALNLGMSNYQDLVVKEVRYGAFYYSPLQNIYVGRNIQAMREGVPFSPYHWEEGAFVNKYYDAENAVVNVAVGPKVTQLAARMFACLPMTEINIPNGITKIDKGMFMYCDKLAKIDIPASVELIGADAFYGCESLRRVYIEDSNTPLNLGCSLLGSDRLGPFYDSPLEYIYCGRDIQQITEINATTTALDWNQGVFAHKFYNDENLTTSVTLGPKVTKINQYMFNYVRMNSINIPVGVTSIGHNAFKGCKQLAGISIPGTVENIGYDAFCGCSSLKTLRFEDGETPLTIGHSYLGWDEYGPFYDSPLTNIYCGRDFVQIDYQDNLSPADSWEEGIFANKFYKDESVALSVTIGPKVTAISEYAFNYLRFNSINIPNSVTSIGKLAFRSCVKLSSLSIPGSVETIGDDAFYDCSGLKTLRIEDSDKPLKLGYTYEGTDEYAPFYDSPLTYIYCGRDIVQVDSDGDPSVADSWEEGVFTNFGYEDASIIVSLNIGEKVTTILDYMFSKLRVKSVWLYPTVTSIGYRAFYECKAFQGLSCGHETPPTLGAEAFSGCDAMWYIRVPESSMSKFKSADGWKEYDRNNNSGNNFYYPL